MNKASKTLSIPVMILIPCCTLFIAGCGGGGGSADTSIVQGTNTTPPVEATVDYQPNTDKLHSSAEASPDLYVSPDFNFSMNRLMNTYITVSDPNSQPMPDTLVKVYAVPEKTEQWEELNTDDKQLLFVGKTDSNGLMDKSIEVATTVSKLLVVVSAVGVENMALLNVDSDNVSYHFE